jgi:dolichol-phosphate mannosyltransferase
MQDTTPLIFIPTYNERDNVRLIIEGLRLNLPAAPILFCDDNSPDGTSGLLNDLAREFGNIIVHTRPGKLGIGSAHKFGIRQASAMGFTTLLTLDCDLTHKPSDAARMLRHPSGDVVVGTRFRSPESLATWNPVRRAITKSGHAATKSLLGIPYDATGALRRYRLDCLGTDWVDLVRAEGYAFFFESLMVLHQLGRRIEEISIDLPKRTCGNSKMSIAELFRSSRMLLWLAMRRRRLLK